MASRDEFKRARAWLLLEKPIYDDATLLNLEEAAADFIRAVKRRDSSFVQQSAVTRRNLMWRYRLWSMRWRVNTLRTPSENSGASAILS
jgi:hypothetical protein